MSPTVPIPSIRSLFAVTVPTPRSAHRQRVEELKLAVRWDTRPPAPPRPSRGTSSLTQPSVIGRTILRGSNPPRSPLGEPRAAARCCERRGTPRLIHSPSTSGSVRRAAFAPRAGRPPPLTTIPVPPRPARRNPHRRLDAVRLRRSAREHHPCHPWSSAPSRCSRRRTSCPGLRRGPSPPPRENTPAALSSARPRRRGPLAILSTKRDRDLLEGSIASCMPASMPDSMIASRIPCSGLTRIVSVVRPPSVSHVFSVPFASLRHALVDLGGDDPLVRDDLAVLAVEGDLEAASAPSRSATFRRPAGRSRRSSPRRAWRSTSA